MFAWRSPHGSQKKEKHDVGLTRCLSLSASPSSSVTLELTTQIDEARRVRHMIYILCFFVLVFICLFVIGVFGHGRLLLWVAVHLGKPRKATSQTNLMCLLVVFGDVVLLFCETEGHSTARQSKESQIYGLPVVLLSCLCLTSSSFSVTLEVASKLDEQRTA